MTAKRKSGRGGARPGAGRKPKALEEKRGRKVTVALTGREYESLRSLSGDEALALYVRRLVLRHLRRKG